MSNVKQVHIAGSVPFNWLDPEFIKGKLDDEDAAWLGRLFLTPTIGLRIEYEFAHYQDNDDGGKTAIYLFDVVGQEAIAYPALEKLTELIEKAGGDVEVNDVVDLEAV